ncbi:hypothetical protein ACROYT_G015679 [Oculina patagonica]
MGATAQRINTSVKLAKVNKGELLAVDNPKYQQSINNHSHLKGIKLDDFDTKELSVHVVLGSGKYTGIKTGIKPHIGRNGDPVIPDAKFVIGQLNKIDYSDWSEGTHGLFSFTFNMADDYDDACFERFLGEAFASLKENGGNIVLKEEQRKAIHHLFEKDIVAVLPNGFGKSLIFQLFVLMTIYAQRGFFTGILRYVFILFDEMKIMTNLALDKLTGELIEFTVLGDTYVNFVSLEKVYELATHALAFLKQQSLEKNTCQKSPVTQKAPNGWGSDHEGSLYHPATMIDIGIQVESADDLQASGARDNSEVSLETELDRHVQVKAQSVFSSADLCHDALDAMVLILTFSLTWRMISNPIT